MNRGLGIRSRNTTVARRGRPAPGPAGPSGCVAAAVMAAVALVATALVVMVLCVSPAWAVPLPDYNEPNDSFASATALVKGETAWGALTPEADLDYFYLDLPGSCQVTMHFNPNTVGRNAEVAFRPQDSATVSYPNWTKDYDSDGSYSSHGTLGPGRLFVIVSLVGGAAPSTAAYDLTASYTGGSTEGFLDVKESNPFYAPIMYLADKGVVSGYGDGNFGPNNRVTRQQFAKMIVRALSYPVSPGDDCRFWDVEKSTADYYVDPDDPLYPDHYVAVAELHGITKGQTPSTFAPYYGIMLCQVTSMVVRAGEDQLVYTSIPHWYEPPFADFGPPHYELAREGAFFGLFDSFPGPWNWFTPPATRGQCAFFIWRLMTAVQGG
jgi:hypothetical protein